MEEEVYEILDEDFFDLGDDLFKNLYIEEGGKNLYIEEGGVDNEDTAEEDCAGGACKI